MSNILTAENENKYLMSVRIVGNMDSKSFDKLISLLSSAQETFKIRLDASISVGIDKANNNSQFRNIFSLYIQTPLMFLQQFFPYLCNVQYLLCVDIRDSYFCIVQRDRNRCTI
jgi:hypothetical protein